ncbi:hypothetical protein D3C80_1697560 [compost metagenome]
MGCFFKLLSKAATAICKTLYERFSSIVEDLRDFLRTCSEDSIQLTGTFFKRNGSRIGNLSDTGFNRTKFHRDARTNVAEARCNGICAFSKASFSAGKIFRNT